MKSQCSPAKSTEHVRKRRQLAGGVTDVSNDDENIVFLLNESLKEINTGESTPFE